jgi:hypothetical protein
MEKIPDRPLVTRGLDGFKSAQHDGWLITHHPNLDGADVAAHVRAHLARVQAGTSDDLKTGKKTSTARGSLKQGDETLEVATKWYQWRGLRRAFGDGLYGTLVERAVGGATLVTGAGLHTPEVVAVAERREFGLVRDSMLITTFLGDARTLQEELQHLAGQREAACTLARLLGTDVGKLHVAGINHSDMKVSNVMVCPGPSLSWIDLDALIPRRRLTQRRRVRALGQLEAYSRYLGPWITRTARVHFWRAYAAADPSVVERRREILAEVQVWAAAKIAAWKARSWEIDFREPAEDPQPIS